MLICHEVLFETTVVDLGIQTEAEVIAYKDAHAKSMLARVHLFRESERQAVEAACRQILITSVPLYFKP